MMSVKCDGCRLYLARACLCACVYVCVCVRMRMREDKRDRERESARESESESERESERERERERAVVTVVYGSNAMATHKEEMSTYVHTKGIICTRMYKFVYVCVCMYVCACVCMCVCVRTYVYIYTYHVCIHHKDEQIYLYIQMKIVKYFSQVTAILLPRQLVHADKDRILFTYQRYIYVQHVYLHMQIRVRIRIHCTYEYRFVKGQQTTCARLFLKLLPES